MTSSACPHCGGTSVVFTTEALGITREQGIARACKACAQVGIGPTTIEELCAMVDVEVRAGGCKAIFERTQGKEWCARASQGHPECESEWDCADPNVVAECMERVARERRAEEYNDAVIFNGGIHPANVPDYERE